MQDIKHAPTAARKDDHSDKVGSLSISQTCYMTGHGGRLETQDDTSMPFLLKKFMISKGTEIRAINPDNLE